MMSRSPSSSTSATSTDCEGDVSAGLSPRVVPGLSTTPSAGMTSLIGPRYSLFVPPSLTVTMSGKSSLLTLATTTSVTLAGGVPGSEPGGGEPGITMGGAEKSLRLSGGLR